jgi:hypothetical protein
MTDPPAEADALEWAITAMSDTTGRLPQIRSLDRQRAFALIGEAVWWVTIVDAALVRYHPEAYDRVLSAQPPAARELIEESLAGLRFVRNQMGRAASRVGFIRPRAGQPGSTAGQVTDWRWNSVPEPVLPSVPARGREWEMARYRAYQARLAGQSAEDTFGCAAAFLTLAAAQAAPAANASAPAES